MRFEKGVRLRSFGTIVLGALLLGLVLACSLFNQDPIARIVTNVLSGATPLTVTFDGTTSSDDGTIMSYAWDFGDGDTATGPNAQHTFQTTQTSEIFVVRLTVTDNLGATGTTTQSIEVRFDAPEPGGGTGSPTARFTVDKFIGVDPVTIAFDGSSSFAGSGSVSAYNWDFGDGTQATGATATHTYDPDPEQTTEYVVTLFVWNSNDQLDVAQRTIYVIVPDNDTGDEEPEADIFVTGPELIFESENRPSIPSLFEVYLDPRGSFADAGHDIEYYAWDFGDGDVQVETSDLEVRHVYELQSPTRTFVASLTVFDDQGLEHTAVVNITLVDDPELEGE